MFAINRNRAAPVTTPVFSVPAPNTNFAAYAQTLRCTNTTTTATIMSMVLTIATTAIAEANNLNPTPLIRGCIRVFHTGAAVAIVALSNAQPLDPPDENDLCIQAARLNIGSASGWLSDLINAAKKKLITTENVNGYFASLGHDGTNAAAVVSMINQIRGFFPDMIMDANFRNTLLDNVWTTYRVSRTSAGGILRDLLPVFRDVGITVNGDANEALIMASALAPWDVAAANLIPSRLKGYAYVYLMAAGTPIEDWYQGKDAFESFPASRVRNMRAAFTIYLNLKNNIGEPTDYADIAAITAPASRIRQMWS